MLVLALLTQLVWHAVRPAPVALVQALPNAPRAELARAAALGDGPALARLLSLWLQAFDNPPGVNVPFRDLDYARLERWLEVMLELDAEAQFPLLAAARVYGAVPDAARTRRMLEFVHRRFLEAPVKRWRWMADAALIARHRLHDLDLARDYAKSLTERTKAGEVPFWARDLYVLVLEDRCELEAARIIIGGLVSDGQISDPRELAFLEAKLDALGRSEGCPSPDRPPQR
jgi:hypothetical protein